MEERPTNDLEIVGIVKSFLDRNDVKVQTPRIRQLFKQDINGDGRIETLIAASSRTERADAARLGDYNLVLLRYTNAEGKLVRNLWSGISTPRFIICWSLTGRA